MKSVTEIEKEVKKKEAISRRIVYLEELKLSDFIKDDDIRLIENEILLLKNELSLKAEKYLSDLENFLNSFDLNYEKIENAKFEYLYQNFIVKNEITMFAAPPSSGKSLISVALCNIFLLEKRIDQIIYFDADNGTATLKERNIHKLKRDWTKKFRYFHESQTTKAQMLQIINQLKKTNLTNALIVFDSIKNFMIGGDRDKNRDVSKVMEVLKSLRSRGATVIFLHHTNKPNKDLEELIYAGSSAFQEDTGNAYIMQKNEYKESFIFKNFKARTGNLADIAFHYEDSHTLTEIDFVEASETQEIVEINEVVIEFLEKQSQKPSFSQIMKHLQQQGYSRNKSNQALQNGKGRYWHEEKLTQNNKSVYSLISQKPNVVEIEYFDTDNNLQRTEQIVKNSRISDTGRISPIFRDCNNSSTSV